MTATLASIVPVVALVLAARPAGGAGTGGPSREPIRIGLYGSFSLPNNGPSMRDGARLAAEEIDEAGGVLGRRIELVERDDGGEPAAGVRIVRELAGVVHVAALLGPSLTVVGRATAVTVNEVRIPAIVTGATGSPVNELIGAGEGWVFGFSLSDRIQTSMMAREAIEVRGRRRPAILHEATAFGEGGRDRLVEAIRHRGVEPVYVGAFSPDGKDAVARVEAARAAGADVLLTYAVSGPSARLVRALERIGWRVELVGSWALSHEGFLHDAGPFAEGAIMPQTFFADGAAGPRAARFLARWKARYGAGIWSPSAAAQAYDALHLLAMAFEQAGTTDAPQVRAALENLRRPYDGVTGRHWRPWSPVDHEGIERGSVRMGVVRGGRIVELPPR